MLVTYIELVDLIDQGMIVGKDGNTIPVSNINGASVDITIGKYLLYEERKGRIVDLSQKESTNMSQVDLVDSPYILKPNEFALVQSYEIFNLPNDIAFIYKLKSSQSRSGLDAANAGFADPGWNGSVLTIHLKNNTQDHSFVIKSGMKLGQCVFFRGKAVPNEESYAVRGQYNNDKIVTSNKGVR